MTKWRVKTYDAGVLLSSISSAFRLTPANFLDCTLTTTRTGLRRPTLTISDSASVMVAENSPVLLCLGSWSNMRVIAFVKPRSSNLGEQSDEDLTRNEREENHYRSASSNTSTSNSFTLTMPAPLPSKNSSTLPGVPITISDPFSKNLEISWAGVESVPETRSSGGGKGGLGVDGAEEMKVEKTLWIWVASSLYVMHEC